MTPAFSTPVFVPVPVYVDIVNFSTVFADADVPALALAVQTQVERDFLPHWDTACQVYYGKTPVAGHWLLGVYDNSDQAGALGYHTVTVQGQPIMKVFAKDTIAAGDLVSVTVSHELLEALADPMTTLAFQDGSGKFWAGEVGDPVEADADGYLINGVTVSDFILPSWFGGSGPFDFQNKITAAFGLSPGGYAQFLDPNNAGAGWQQVTARAAGKDPSPGRMRVRGTR